MSKYYGIVFSNSDPGQYPSLAPTFLTFKNTLDGNDVTPPTLTQLSTTGVYGFTFSATFPAYFRVDGITIASATDRFVIGVVDPVLDVDSQLTAASTSLLAIGSSNIALGTTAVNLGTLNFALGTTNVAIGTTLTGFGVSIYAISASIYASSTTLSLLNTLIGDTASAFGTNVVDPTTVFGYLKRMQEFNEGAQVFSKTTGNWTISSRGGSLIADKQLSNSSAQVTRN